MLDLVRNKQKSILIKVVFGLIILSFVIGYTMLTAPSGQSTNRDSDVAASVNGDKISYAEFQNAYSNLYNLYQNIYQDNFDDKLEKQLNLPKQALQQLIEELLLVQQANQLNLKVSRKELIDSIAQYDAFRINGEFNRDRYLQVLNYQRITPEQFEASQRQQLLTRKVRDNLRQGGSISDNELKAAFRRKNDKVNLNYTWITPALVENKVKVTKEGLKTFFEQNIEQYRVPEKRALRYLQFDPARYENEIDAFSDEDLQRHYRHNLDLFEIQEQVKAAHILLRVPKDADTETIRKRRDFAAELLKQLKEGANFAQLAKTYSEDKSNAAQGGDLGTFGRGLMVSEFEKAAFASSSGQLSKIIQTPFGFHIIKVEKHIEAGFKPLVDVIEEVKAGLILEQSRQLAYEKAMDAYNINRKIGNLEAAATANNLSIKETAPFSTDDAIAGIGKVVAINKAAFTLEKGKLARPAQTTQGVFLFTLKERQPSRLPELAEVRISVEQDYRAKQAQSLAKEMADKLLTLATQQKSLRSAAKSMDLAIEESGEFSRSFGSFIPRIGAAQDLTEEAFSLTEEAPVAAKVYTVGNKYLVASLKEAKVADFEALDDAERSQLKKQLLAEKKEQMIAQKIEELLQQAQIEIMVPELISTFKTGSKKL